MKAKTLLIIIGLSFTLMACNKSELVEETTNIVEFETVTEEREITKVEETTTEIVEETTTEQGTVEGHEATEEEKELIIGAEISLDLEESTVPVGTEISPLAGTTSKHGYVYPADYITGGPKEEDHIGDVEMAFDMGWITEEEYQHDLEFFKQFQAAK